MCGVLAGWAAIAVPLLGFVLAIWHNPADPAGQLLTWLLIALAIPVVAVAPFLLFALMVGAVGGLLGGDEVTPSRGVF